MSKPAVNLSTLAAGKGPLSARQLKQLQYWIDADWESHDIDRNAVKVMQRLLHTITPSAPSPKIKTKPERRCFHNLNAHPGQSCPGPPGGSDDEG